MTVPPAPAWVERLEPPVPASFAGWLDRIPEERGETDDVAARRPSLDALLEGGLAALGDALGGGREPRADREGAFELLAADGLLTYACQAALDADDPEAALRRLVAEVDGVRGESGDR